MGSTYNLLPSSAAEALRFSVQYVSWCYSVIPKLLLVGFFLSSFSCVTRKTSINNNFKTTALWCEVVSPWICWLQRPQSWNFWGICRPYKGITLVLYSNTLLMGSILHISWCSHWICPCICRVYIVGPRRWRSFQSTVANQRRCDFGRVQYRGISSTHGFVSNLDTPFIKFQPWLMNSMIRFYACIYGHQFNLNPHPTRLRHGQIHCSVAQHRPVIRARRVFGPSWTRCMLKTNDHK